MSSLFREAQPGPQSPSEDAPSSGTGGLLDGPSEPGESGQESAGPDRSTSSSRRRRDGGSPANRRKIRLAARKSLIGFSHIAHENLARDDLDEFAGVYLMSEDHAKLIADPLANIGARRMELAGIAGNPDVADALAAIVGFVVYALDQLAIRGEVRRVRRMRADNAQQVPDQGAPVVGEVIS